MRSTLIQNGQPPFRPLRFDEQQKFFWVHDAERLAFAEEIWQRVDDLDPSSQKEFWDGKMPRELLAGLPDVVTKASPAEIVGDCRVWESYLKAKWLLAIKSPGGAKGVVDIGNLRHRDEKTAALERLKLGKPLTDLVVGSGISAAQKAGDKRFFHRLSSALRAKAKSLGKKHSTPCNVLDQLLVNHWCGHPYRPELPPLCFFTDEALADFCSAALGRCPGNPSHAALLKRRQRLGLKHPRISKISSVAIPKGKVLLS
jgi:hypothetical protein